MYLLNYIGIILLVKEFVGEKRSVEYKQEFHDVLQKWSHDLKVLGVWGKDSYNTS